MSDRLANSPFAKRFGLTTPIALAPMALASGGELAAACAKAGALGLIGGGYGDPGWTQREYGIAAQALSTQPEAAAQLGCGFITWRMKEDRSALDYVLDRERPPAAIMLSFGDPSELARDIVARGVPLICQIQTMAQLPQAVDAGASVIVGQGVEAGGHGMKSAQGRSTFTFVPEIADWLAAHAPHVDLLAAGGVADGRGLAAAMTLGADGALIGSRLWATQESLAADAAIAEAVQAGGDDTARSGVFDILREKNWPAEYDFRALRNALHRKWENRLDELRADPEAAIADYKAGVAAQDYSRAHVTVGEGTGLISENASATQVIEAITYQAGNFFR
ncbi:MAG: nitronate monooxygenase [Erythrobacter sp.]|uniref:nitronate monooxygenase n=1 Tax=Erythrobacter sp. TaxID=1042 RepID=UPI002634BE7A|nr:nitronate monooxygenase [Erythrobacter sp.]MDJ0978298.1 nitronate monooxygenase [Erythrobacter sp.]